MSDRYEGAQTLPLGGGHRPPAGPSQQTSVFTTGHGKHIMHGGVLSYTAQIVVDKGESVVFTLEHINRPVPGYHNSNCTKNNQPVHKMGKHCLVFLQQLFKQPVTII